MSSAFEFNKHAFSETGFKKNLGDINGGRVMRIKD
jgi:hypothetical protein